MQRFAPLSRALCLALSLLAVWPAAPRADEAGYEVLMAAGSTFYEDRDYAAAAQAWAAAVGEAEAFGPLDSRLAASLNSLAEARRAQARTRTRRGSPGAPWRSGRPPWGRSIRSSPWRSAISPW